MYIDILWETKTAHKRTDQTREESADSQLKFIESNSAIYTSKVEGKKGISIKTENKNRTIKLFASQRSFCIFLHSVRRFMRCFHLLKYVLPTRPSFNFSDVYSHRLSIRRFFWRDVVCVLRSQHIRRFLDFTKVAYNRSFALILTKSCGVIKGLRFFRFCYAEENHSWYKFRNLDKKIW